MKESSIFRDPIGRRRALTVVLALLVVGLLVHAFSLIWGTPVSFDGAMNLQVAASLAEGRGYGRFFDEWVLFPREIQTNAPYLFPAALVFALFGVSLATAQLVSLAYLAGLVLIIFLLGRRLAGPVSALIACVLVLVVPELSRLGANGYGEVPALFWLLTGLWVLHRALDADGRWRYMVAGMCFGLSILTKTVMLMPVGVVLGLLASALLWSERNWRDPARTGAGLLVPIVCWEAWKLWAIGGVTPWLGWWQVQLDSILRQAGVSEGFQDSPGHAEKLIAHADVLAGSLGLPLWLLPVLLGIPATIAVILFLRIRKEGIRDAGALVAMMVCACILAYFTWWLLVTPTQKAWYRRIFNGVLLLMLCAPLLPALARHAGRYSLSIAVSVVSVALLLGGSLQRFTLTMPISQEVRERSTRAVVDFMKAAPPNARFFGYRWYSQPVFGLYSGRPIFDIDKHKYWITPEQGPHFLPIDGYMNSAGAADKALRGFEHEQVLEDSNWGRVVKLTSEYELSPFDDEESQSSRPEIDFLAGDDGPVRGMFPPERDGWRWAEPLAAAVLAYEGEDVLVVRGSSRAPAHYRFPGDHERFGIRARVADCDLGWQYPDNSGKFDLTWLLEDCELSPKTNSVPVQLRASAILNGNGRPLSWVAHEIRLQPQSTTEYQ